MDVTQLFEQHGETILRYLFRLTGDEEVAADALQTAFLAAIETPPRHQNHLRAWLFTAATNAARKTLRDQSRRQELLTRNADCVPTAVRPTPPDQEVDLQYQRQAVREALAGLSLKERTALLMRGEGFKHREIAEALDTTTQTVGTLLARGVKKLAAELHTMRDELL